jgi:hypothetical protein
MPYYPAYISIYKSAVSGIILATHSLAIGIAASVVYGKGWAADESGRGEWG